MSLISVYSRQDRCLLLFKLLAERDDTVNISHAAMPTWEQHINFVNKKPYEKWFFGMSGDTVVGACYLTKQNEIGIFVFKEYQGMGFGKAILRTFLAENEPLPGIPSVRADKFVANINPRNERSRKLFESLGFKLRQMTYDL